MISLLRKLQYTDSVPVCPWVTSRPPRNLPQAPRPQLSLQPPPGLRGAGTGAPFLPKGLGQIVLCSSQPHAHPLKSCSLTFWPRNSRNSTKAGLSSLVLKSSSSEVWGHTEGRGQGAGVPGLPLPCTPEKAGRRTSHSPGKLRPWGGALLGKGLRFQAARRVREQGGEGEHTCPSF